VELQVVAGQGAAESLFPVAGVPGLFVMVLPVIVVCPLAVFLFGPISGVAYEGSPRASSPRAVSVSLSARSRSLTSWRKVSRLSGRASAALARRPSPSAAPCTCPGPVPPTFSSRRQDRGRSGFLP
jgi:hypothetical protein